MTDLKERQSFAAIAKETRNCSNYSKGSYLRDLKQNYARRKDNIELIKSNRNLSEQIDRLCDLIEKTGGTL